MVMLCGVWKTGGTERNTKKKNNPTTNKHAPQLTMQANQQQLIPTSYIGVRSGISYASCWWLLS